MEKNGSKKAVTNNKIALFDNMRNYEKNYSCITDDTQTIIFDGLDGNGEDYYLNVNDGSSVDLVSILYKIK